MFGSAGVASSSPAPRAPRGPEHRVCAGRAGPCRVAAAAGPTSGGGPSCAAASSFDPAVLPALSGCRDSTWEGCRAGVCLVLWRPQSESRLSAGKEGEESK